MDNYAQILSNLDIEQLCYDFKIPLICCCSKDELKNMKPRNGGYVINLQNSYDGHGTHWTALFINNDNATYFDPFGEIYPYEIQRFIGKKKLLYNQDTIQNLNQDCCGYYCIDFLHHMNRYKHILPRKSMNYYLNTYSDDTHENDNILQQHLKLIIEKEKIIL